jgi:hypothetical protein
MKTDYPDFLIANFGITDSIKAAVKRLAERVVFKGLAKCFYLSGGAILDRYGNEYGYINVGLNPGASFASVGVGWASANYKIRQHIMDEKTLIDTISGRSISLTGAFIGGVSGGGNPFTGAGTFVISADAQAGIGVDYMRTEWVRKTPSLEWNQAIIQETTGPFAIQEEDLTRHIYP